MENTKEFKTITLRNLDKNTDVVDIMNNVMNDTNIATGQGIIEYIIKDYAKLKHEIVQQSDHYDMRLKAERETNFNLKIALQNRDKCLYFLKKGFELLEDINEKDLYKGNWAIGK